MPSSIISVLFLALFVGSSNSSPAPIGSSSFSRRSILRDISTDEIKGDYGVELNVTNFDEVLRETPATYAIVEFFAHWCPACRNYKHHYEKVARLFNGADAVHPGHVLMTRVDCALKINTELCDKFSVSHYPMLFWGKPSKFVGGSWSPNQENSEIRQIDDGRTAERLLNWINKQLGSSYGLDDEKFENENIQANASDAEQIARAIYDVEEATSTAFEIILEHKMIKSETRASLIKFLQLIVAHHPSRRCRKGSAELLVNFDDFYPSETLSNSKEQPIVSGKESVLHDIHICGKEVPRGYWMFCRGSRNDTRGFSCGLWVLLHSLSVRVDSGESEMAFTATCDFIHNFFVCEDCRQHFYEMCSSVSNPIKNTRDFVLWLWNAHNKVNKRLMKDEASLGSGDPKFPKAVWPSKQLCRSCYRSQKTDDDGQIDWDEDEIFKFLVSYYGTTLVSLSKDKEELLNDVSNKVLVKDVVATTNAIVVPIGAAFAIAVASCGFGGLAWFWRSRQKNRKYKHHPLKSI
ncbi:OLC1v1032137C1 [Oldenlandia corymbosa var. corymbosa]|uniref:Sulfhydryl oxidase n=1 Tax=Oldenlandia corymbosa var. corymbosa TaxID=529605 RepID=A0AAV1CLU5_OLDCO|nr:OLC1v1032137C1 [Oldenlandia corymbosa var. corymbosa]